MKKIYKCVSSFELEDQDEDDDTYETTVQSFESIADVNKHWDKFCYADRTRFVTISTI